MDEATSIIRGFQEMPEVQRRLLFGDNVRHFRNLHGYSLTELADRASMDKSNLSRIELGKVSITDRTAAILAKALGVTVLRLYGPRQDLVDAQDLDLRKCPKCGLVQFPSDNNRCRRCETKLDVFEGTSPIGGSLFEERETEGDRRVFAALRSVKDFFGVGDLVKVDITASPEPGDLVIGRSKDVWRVFRARRFGTQNLYFMPLLTDTKNGFLGEPEMVGVVDEIVRPREAIQKIVGA